MAESDIPTQQSLEDSFDGTFNDNIHKNKGSKEQPRKGKFIINVADTQYAVVKHVARKQKWNLSCEPHFGLNFDLCWTDNHVKQDLFARMQTFQKINHFPGMAILSRKNNLGRNLMLFKSQFPSEYDFFPLTWTLPYDYPELAAYHDARKQGKAQTFIVKPEASCQGRGIFLTRNIERLKNEKCVVQRYLHKPFLIDGLKFDLRIYVLVAGIDPLRIFVYEEGLARFATEAYKPPRSQNLDNMFMHLTNYAINKQHPNFIFNESVSQMDVGHKRSLTSVYKRLAAEGHDVEAMKQRINDMFIKTVLTGYPTLSNGLQAAHPDNFANDMCFEILGFDVMLDHKLNPTLLEINYTPSFTTDTPLDRYIKKSLIADTLEILNINEKWRRQVRAKRDQETQDRIITGKRKKYTPQERIELMIQQARRRDAYEKDHMGKFTKIFIQSEEQFMQYLPYYDYSMHIYYRNLKLESSNTYTVSSPYISGPSYSNNYNSQSSRQPFTLYHHYFQGVSVRKPKKETVRGSVKAIPPKNDDNRFHHNEVSKRVASAKSRPDREKGLNLGSLERKNSKKSLLDSQELKQLNIIKQYREAKETKEKSCRPNPNKSASNSHSSTFGLGNSMMGLSASHQPGPSSSTLLQGPSPPTPLRSESSPKQTKLFQNSNLQYLFKKWQNEPDYGDSTQ